MSLPLRCSLAFLLILTFAWGQEAARLARKAESVDPSQLAQVIESSPLYEREEPLHNEVERLRATRQEKVAEQAETVRSMLRIYAAREADAETGNAGQLAKEVKKSAFYRDPGVSEDSNWLSRALQRLRNLLNLRFGQKPSPAFAALQIGQWLTYLAWGLLVLGAAVFALLTVRHLRWKATLKRRATAMLEEDEPERTVDEWLAMADRYEAEGDYRRAVRSLYLACLLRIDEVGIARFDRGQTNWEHLDRIGASGKLPSGIDFVTSTREFDRIWYGSHVKGREDVAYFRGFYHVVKERTSEVAI